ncbi:hypothetical protein [Zooshikella ganghwensis]|uniref:Uncharacterized protein n=1 Tax=Zooshikella ganghwensis TaxID=202772 RepID=A0A4P9VGV1_9GAMM|nr:hypothetical protein [Zooshikella ganghwensis]RDH41337.1 hypothetical protein B9G39_29140 [Zooshikella ganghwensis]
MSLDKITATDIGAWSSRIASYLLSSYFAYTFVQDLGYLAIVLALLFILVTDLACIESLKRLILRQEKTAVDVFVFVLCLGISVVTISGVVTSVSLNDHQQHTMVNERLQVLNDKISARTDEIEQLKKERTIYTESEKIRLEVNARNEKIKVLTEEKEAFQEERLVLLSGDIQQVDAYQSIAISWAAFLPFSVQQVNVLMGLLVGLVFDFLKLVFIYWQTRAKQTSEDVHEPTHHRSDSDKLQGQSALALVTNQPAVMSQSAVPAGTKGVLTARNGLPEETISKAITIIQQEQITKGFHKRLRDSLEIADARARQLCHELMQRQVLVREGKHYKLGPAFQWAVAA